MTAAVSTATNPRLRGILTRLLRAARQTPPDPAEPSANDPVIGMDSDTRSAMAEVLAAYGSRPNNEFEDDDYTLAREVEEAPIVRMATTILQQAIKDGASHIHFEPDGRNVRVRYRIDGGLREVLQMPGYVTGPLTRRLKVLADLPASGGVAPLTGYIGLRYKEDDYDLRLTTLPNLHREKLTLRIYDHRWPKAWNRLGLSSEHQQTLQHLSQRKTGLLLFAGTPNCGKTTTAYAVLNRIDATSQSLLTVSEGREYVLPGVTQVFTSGNGSVKLSDLLESLPRQDVEAVLLDEVRDAETARFALEAARDRLVLTTVRAPDAIAGLERLIAWSSDAGLVAQTVCGVVAQRLVCKICSNCREEYDIPAIDLRMFGHMAADDLQTVTIARGTGCHQCWNSGYRGQTGVFELLRVTPELRALVSGNAPAIHWRSAAQPIGDPTLTADGLNKVLQLLTTPDEIVRQVFT